MAAGSISSEEFNDLAKKFAKFSSTINDTWIVKTSPRDSTDFYLEKTEIVMDRGSNQDQCTNDSGTEAEVCIADDGSVEDVDPSCVSVAMTSSHDVLHCLYHVVFSHSYSVPVLYFNLCRPDGKRLGLEEVWSKVPAEFQQRMQHHKWTTLTQQEHPHLGSPFFMLHPCHTASLMSQTPCPQDHRYYLVKWLSSVGPVVGLTLSTAYAAAFDLPTHA